MVITGVTRVDRVRVGRLVREGLGAECKSERTLGGPGSRAGASRRHGGVSTFTDAIISITDPHTLPVSAITGYC